MNDPDLLESARPDVAPLTDDERQWLRTQIFPDIPAAHPTAAAPAESYTDVNSDNTVLVVAGPRPPSTRRWLAWAAAVAVVACGAIIASQRRGIEPVEDASPPNPAASVSDASVPQTTTVDGKLAGDAPAWPPRFPALDPSDPDNTNIRMVSGQLGFENPQRTTTVIGRRVGSTLSDLAYVSALDSGAFATAMAHVYLPATTETIDGATITVYRLSNPEAIEATAIIEHPDGPDIAVTAADPLGLIRSTGTGFATATTEADGSIGLDISETPPGYVAVVDPYIQVGGQSIPGMQWGEIGQDDATAVNVYLGSPQISVDRTLQATAVDDTPAWFDAVASVVYWQIQPGVWASVTTSGGLDAVLALTARIQFVDETTWRTRYPDTNQFFGDTPTVTTTPPVDGAAASTSDATDATRPERSSYCDQVDMLGGERPDSYVGSDQHLADVDRLLNVAPATVADLIETYRAFLASGAVDPSKPDSQLTENWPADIQNAIREINQYNAATC